jgi:hypothetical protein
MVQVDRLVLATANSYNMQPLYNHEAVYGAISTDFKTWTPVRGMAEFDITFSLAAERPLRYFKLCPCPERINAVKGTFRGQALDRTRWRASNLFADRLKATLAWSATVTIEQVYPGSYLVVPVFGPHVPESVYAAARCGSRYLGASRRAAAYPANPLSCAPIPGKNYSYFIPLDCDVAGKPIDVFLLGSESCAKEALSSEVWLSAYPTPHVSRSVLLKRNGQSM